VPDTFLKSGRVSPISGFQNDFDAAVILIEECLLQVRAFFKRRAMRNDEGRVDLAFRIRSISSGR
jgi:hypothetical protein